MNPNDKDLWMKEFQEFSQINSESVKVPAALFQTVKNRLFPNPWKVFGKIAGIHALVGFFSLGICNQFGLNPFNTTYSLSEWFMRTGGHSVCMVFCGVFFIATTYLLANIILNLEELEAVRKYEWLQTGILSIGSLAAFYFFGGEIILSFGLLWILGAFLGGLLSIEGSYRLRRQWT
jgi:hypothetical protein